MTPFQPCDDIDIWCDISLREGEGALACQSCYEGFTFMSGICESQCLVGFYGISQVTESLHVTHFTKFLPDE